MISIITDQWCNFRGKVGQDREREEWPQERGGTGSGTQHHIPSPLCQACKLDMCYFSFPLQIAGGVAPLQGLQLPSEKACQQLSWLPQEALEPILTPLLPWGTQQLRIAHFLILCMVFLLPLQGRGCFDIMAFCLFLDISRTF